MMTETNIQICFELKYLNFRRKTTIRVSQPSQNIDLNASIVENQLFISD